MSGKHQANADNGDLADATIHSLLRTARGLRTGDSLQILNVRPLKIVTIEWATSTTVIIGFNRTDANIGYQIRVSLEQNYAVFLHWSDGADDSANPSEHSELQNSPRTYQHIANLQAITPVRNRSTQYDATVDVTDALTIGRPDLARPWTPETNENNKITAQ